MHDAVGGEVQPMVLEAACAPLLMTSSPTHAPTQSRLTALVLAVLVGCGVAIPLDAGATAHAQAPPAAVERRQAIEADLEAATAEEQRAAAELVAATAERDRLTTLLADVERRSHEAIAAHQRAEAVLLRAEAELRAAEARLETTERALAEALGTLQAQAVDSFIAGGGSQPFAVLTEAEDIRAFGAASTYRDLVLEKQDAVVERVEDLQATRARETERAAAARVAATSAVAEASARQRVVEAERSELQVLESASATAVAAHEALLADAHLRRAVHEAELAALVEVSDSLAAALAARQSGQTADPALHGTFVVPVPSARMSSSFGPRTHPIFGSARLHAGMDLAAPTGTPIGAGGAGTVVTSGVLGGYGNAVVIDHGNGLSTLYGHLSALHARVGDVVEATQTIGLVGSTGNSTGPHLHFEVRVFGTPVDPISYL